MPARRPTARRWNLAWCLLPLTLAWGGCQEGSQEALASHPIQIDSVDVRLTATDTRTGSVITSDFPPAGGAQSGPSPLSITETVPTTGQSVVPVDVADDAVPANRYTGGRINIR
jgi:hypothetical protein